MQPKLLIFMRVLTSLLATPFLMVSCIPEGSGTQGSAPRAPEQPAAPLSPAPSAPAQRPHNLVEERLKTQSDRIGRLETELHEMRLLFTNQLKRIEEVANRPVQMPSTAYQQQQQPQQVVIMPNNPVVTHRWDEQAAPQYGASRQARNYQVRSGDTLSEIAEAHGVPTSSLVTANPGINPLRLQIGNELTIPSSDQAARYQAQARTRARTYQVRAGDTLSEIAEAHGIGLSQLLASNPGVDPKRLAIGKTLKVPSTTRNEPTRRPAGYASPQQREIQRQPQATPQSQLQPQYKSHPTHTPAPSRTEEQTHKMFIRMKQDTTLGEIALRHHTDVETLNRLNHSRLSAAAKIRANNTLYVPTAPPAR